MFPQLAAVGVGLVAALRHQLGGGLGIPHGEASTIVLPHVMRYNLPAAADQYGRAAAALGLATPEALIGRIEALTAELGLPGRLRDTGIARADLDGALVDHVLDDGGSRWNIAPVDAAGFVRSSTPLGEVQDGLLRKSTMSGNAARSCTKKRWPPS